MKLVITDDPVSEAKLALAKERYDRKQVFFHLQGEGHVRIIEDNDPVHIRCQIEDEIFSDPRDRFPSTVTMAKLQLAIAAGRSCRNDTTVIQGPPGGLADAFPVHPAPRRWLSRTELEANIMVTAHHGPTKTGITAAVMGKWRKVAKGLRP